jgi:DNA helicase II / ATP-dependent DNA helicase PcrA
MKLNDEQLVNLESDVRFKCVLASAGSGKTNTIIHHIANDLSKGIKPAEIIAFTFTNKAAEDLLGRVIRHCKQHLLLINIEGLYIGTIHS